MTRYGVRDMLHRRGQQAGLSGPLFPHRWRHHFGHRWKAAGGSTEGLKYVGGWTSDKMPEHYGRSALATRALHEQQRLFTD